MTMTSPNSPRVYIIAEAGVNHNGEIALARELIDIAVETGADAVKFQTFNADTLVTSQAPKAAYQKETTDAGESQFDMIRRLELKRENHQELMDYCIQKDIEFLSTPFDIDSIRFLMELGIQRIKIPSGEITNLPYLRYAGAQGCPIILSTGMSDIDEIHAAIAVLNAAGCPNPDITLLHCNTQYPTPFSDVNLRAMQTIANTFPEVRVGYSDHTPGIEVPTAAVALGARVIEKHFTLDRSLEGPDHAASLEPDELFAMIESIRHIEAALGSGVKIPSPSETDNIRIVRKSIVAARPIKCGETYTEENLTSKRPGSGISPMRWDDLIGTPANRDYHLDELIEP